MPTYNVYVPVVAKVTVGVVADSPEEAKAIVQDQEFIVDVVDPEDMFEFIEHEWDIYEKVVEGRVYHGPINEISVEEDDWGYSDDE